MNSGASDGKSVTTPLEAQHLLLTYFHILSVSKQNHNLAFRISVAISIPFPPHNWTQWYQAVLFFQYSKGPVAQ